MNPIPIVAVILAASTTVLSGGPVVRVESRIDVSQPGENYHSNLGVVHGVRSCGGPGRVVQWRIEGCSPHKTCQVPADDRRRPAEVEFIPSRDIDAIGIRVILITQDGQAKQVYERPISESSVQGGETYIVNAAGGAAKELKGQTITLQNILYSVEDNNVEVCVEADFEIV